jgi:hypothetical protein
MGESVPLVAGASAVAASAVCCSCGKPILGWRESLLPIFSGELAATERGELALRVDYRARCDGCGGDRAEIRVEATGRALGR